MFRYLPAIEAVQSEKKSSELKKLIKKNRVSFLTHFTHIDNLRSILQFGLLPSSVLKNNRTFSSVRYNSVSLPPGWEKFVSFNISFPDYRLFAQLQNHQPSDWIVLLIDISVVRDFPCYFFPKRANECIAEAAQPGRVLDLYQKGSDFADLFKDRDGIKRSDLDIPQFYPTNPCSEVLSSFPISPAYITQVFFYSDYKFNQWVLSNTEFAISQDKNRWACGLQFFSPRSDYTYWKSERTA